MNLTLRFITILPIAFGLGISMRLIKEAVSGNFIDITNKVNLFFDWMGLALLSAIGLIILIFTTLKEVEI